MIDAIPQAALTLALVAATLRVALEVYVRTRPRSHRRIEWDRPDRT